MRKSGKVESGEEGSRPLKFWCSEKVGKWWKVGSSLVIS
uniref:Uncharacterized protein n=1 Tax=Moniliophthora roreri TaxID=221103 RepID=A0A0W0FM00_MONRR